MTLPLSMKKTQKETLITDFMQTVKIDLNLESFLMRWANVNEQDTFGFTALYWAIANHNMHNVKLLLDFGCTLEVSSTQNAMFHAIDCNNLKALQYFIERGIDQDIKSSGYTLLEYATRLGKEEIAAYLK